MLVVITGLQNQLNRVNIY